MANFQYTALDAKGEQSTGVLPASSEAEAIQQLRAQGLYPTQVVEEGKGTVAAPKTKSKSKGRKKSSKKTIGGKVKPKVTMIFTRQLATLIDAGLPLLRGLTVLGKQEPNPVLRSTVNALADSVQTGATFSESLAQHPRIFNKLYVNMVKAGELGGVLEVVLTRLAEYMEKAHKLKNKIVSAMVYPVIVLFIAVAILVFLMLFIVPKFRAMFAEQGSEDLPALSKAVFGMSETMLANPLILPNIVWIFLAIAGLVALFKVWSNTTGGRASVDAFKLKLPVFGDLTKKSAISRFTRTLGTLVTSGVPILQALTITRDTAGNVVVSDAVGQLPEMLLKVADVYDDEVDNAVTAMTSILEPIMIVFLALIVGTIVLALFLPLIKMIQNQGDAA